AAVARHSDAGGIDQGRKRGWAAVALTGNVAATTKTGTAGDGSDNSVRCGHLADAGALVFRDVEVAGCIERHRPRRGKPGCGGRAAVAGVAAAATAGHRRDVAGKRIDLADAVGSQARAIGESDGTV